MYRPLYCQDHDSTIFLEIMLPTEPNFLSMKYSGEEASILETGLQ